MKRSSTSSSESGGARLPRDGGVQWGPAGLALFLLVLFFVTQLVMDDGEPPRDPGALPRVVVLGSGRAEQSLLPVGLNTALAGQAEATLLGQVGANPHDVAALAGGLAGVPCEVVLLGLSEFETHRPSQAIAARARSPSESRVLTLAGGRTEEDLAALITRVGMTFPDLSEATRRDELIHLLSLSRGEHVSSRQSLLRAAVERLAEAGASVIVVELPLHPLSRQYYDVTLREEALSFFAELAMDFDVTVVTEEMSGPFAKSDFASLTRVTDVGADKLCHSAARAVLEVLQARQAVAER